MIAAALQGSGAATTSKPAAKGRPATPGKPTAKGRDKPFSDNTVSMQATEMAVAVLIWGWSFDEAHTLIGGCRERARRRIRNVRDVGGLPYVPTPEQVAAECRRLRRWPVMANLN